MVVRGLRLVFGLILSIWGSYLYQIAVLAPGLLGGLWGGLMLGQALHLEATYTLAIAGGLALIGGLICHFVESFAVRLTGAVSFSYLGWSLWPLFRPTAWEAVVAGVVAGMIGAAIFPMVYVFAIKIATAAMGGFLIADASHHPQNPWIVGGVTLLGAVIQTIPWKRPGSMSEKKEKKEKTTTKEKKKR